MSDVSDTIESPEAAHRQAEARGEDPDDAFRFGRPPHLTKWQPAPESRAEAGDVTIEVIDLNKSRDRNRFVDVAEPIYRGDPNYVAPLRISLLKSLNPAKFPPFRHTTMRAVIAYRNGKPVGRLTCQYDDLYNEYHETKAGWFGYFECIDDPAVAHAMFDDGFAWLKSAGMVEVFGPANPTMNYQSGLLIENFERPPVIDTLYNPRYYEALFTSYGLGKAKDLYCWWIDVTNGMSTPKRQRIMKVADRVRKREGISIRSASIKDADREIELIYELFMGGWQKNWGFAPIPRDEFIELAQDLKQVVVEDLLIFVMVNGKEVAFSLTVPDINEKVPKNGRLFPFGWTKLLFGLRKTKFARLYLLGTLPEYRKRGLESIMIVETTLRAHKLGYQGGEIGWTLEDNDLINRPIQTMEADLDRKYRVYGLDLTD